jgi:hypothetical protein
LLKTILRTPVESIQKKMNRKKASETGDMDAAEETAQEQKNIEEGEIHQLNKETELVPTQRTRESTEKHLKVRKFISQQSQFAFG